MSTPVMDVLILAYIFVSILHICLGADLTYYVEEGKSPGTLVGDIATDSHLMDRIPPEEHHLVTFSQLQHGVAGSLQLFRVSKKTGKLYTTQILDAESLCTRNAECFKMVDVAVRKAESFMKIMDIKVTIKDVNEYQPEFPNQRVDIQFSENDKKGTKISIPNAIDRDVGVQNSEITYQLKKNIKPFTLSVSKNVDGTSKLAIKLEDDLDREVKDSYVVQVIARDGGSPSKQSVLDVHVSVTDVNDNTPVFPQKVYNVSIKNIIDGTPVAILSARDLDSGKNGRISYHFTSQTSDVAKSLFKLNEATGEIFLRKILSTGQKLTYKLYVEATDGGNPALSSIAMVLVNVINEKNNAPTIDVNFVSASNGNTVAISEDIKVGSFIAYVKVTDHDAGHNGEVNCDLHHGKFQLESLGVKKYKVVVKNPVDREREDRHEITIICRDKGFPPLHSESKFSIKVMDVNDAQPKFAKDTFKFSVSENQKSKIPVGVINVTDPDLGQSGKLIFSLVNNNKHFLPFQISDNGLISTVMSLDHEFQDVYKFKVLVKDNGIPSLNNTVNVVVEVKDENDNAPYFTFPSVNPYNLDFIYYPHHTNNVTVLRASDKDSRENAFLKYGITKGNEKQLFFINHYTGLLSFTRVVTQQDAGSYDLEFSVKDSGNPVLSATTTISLTLTVSNKTFEMLNAVNIQSEDKVQLYLLILIVLVAVTVSVPVTAFISLCIVQCNDQPTASNRHAANVTDKCINEQGQLICHSHLESSCTDVPAATSGDMHLTGPRRESDDMDNIRKITGGDLMRERGDDFLMQIVDNDKFTGRYQTESKNSSNLQTPKNSRKSSGKMCNDNFF